MNPQKPRLFPTLYTCFIYIIYLLCAAEAANVMLLSEEDVPADQSEADDQPLPAPGPTRARGLHGRKCLLKYC